MKSAAHIDAQLMDRYPILGLARLYHKTTRGQALSFNERPYLVEMYADLPNLPHMVGRKATQTGWSELLIQYALWKAGWKGETVAYVLPTHKDRDRFVAQRINTVLLGVPAYACRVPGGVHGPADGADSLRAKNFGDGRMLFLSSKTPGDFVEFSADTMVIDEFDLCDPANLANARNRLREAPNPQYFVIGNPTLPNIGISAAFDRSDGRRWFHACDRCGHHQRLDWFANIVEKDDSGRWVPRDRGFDPMAGPSGRDIRPVCIRCGEPFNRHALQGQWVAERPGYLRGYAMSRLDVLSQNFGALYIEWLEAQEDTIKIAAFVNGVLGEPWEGRGQAVTMEMLTRAGVGTAIEEVGTDAYKDVAVSAGLDVGSKLNLIISVKERFGPENARRTVRRTVHIGEYQTFKEVERVIRSFWVDCLVVDSLPETRKSKELQNKLKVDDDRGHSCRVWLARYAMQERVGRMAYGMNLNYKDRVVTVDRTQVLDATLDELAADPPSRIFPRDANAVDDFARQMRAPKRLMDKRNRRFIWSKPGPDHYRHADAYDRIARDIINRGGAYHSVVIEGPWSP